jgi:MFS family permease
MTDPASPPLPLAAPPAKQQDDGGERGGGKAADAANDANANASSPPPAEFGADDLTPRQFARVQAALCLGSGIEWYDLAVFGAQAAVITPLFFPPSASGPTQALYYWGVFAMSFITRPVGSLVLGSVGDRWGRRPALLASLVGMAVPTILIGALPTYAQAGIAAPILMALLRAIQGLAMGAEFSTAMLMSVELAPRGRRGLFGSLTFMSSLLGISLANSVVLILTVALTPEQMNVWGWRVPFLLTTVSALGAFVLRMHLPEPRVWRRACVVVEEEEEKKGGGIKTESGDEKTRATPPPRHRARHTSGSPIVKLLKRSWPQVLLQTFYEAWMSVTFYLLVLWLPTAVLQQKHLMGVEASGATTIASLILMAPFCLLSGHAHDVLRSPRKCVLVGMVAIALGTAVAVPGFLSLGRASRDALALGPTAVAPPLEQASAALFQAGMLALAGFALGMIPALCADLYAADHRVVSFSLAHNLSMAILGGTSPLAVAAMAARGQTAVGRAMAAPGVYIAAAGVASLVAAGVLATWAPRWFVAEGGEEKGGAERPLAAVVVVAAAAGKEAEDENDGRAVAA